MPLILRCPGKLPAGKHVEGFVRLQDVAPTILDFLGYGELTAQVGMEGKTMLPLVGSRSRKGLCSDIYLVECSWMKKRGWRTKDWKLIVSLEDPFGLPPVELYDLKNDPKEIRNVAEQHPDVVEQLRKRMERWRTRRMRETGKPDPHSYQDITLRQIGKMETAVPEDQKFEGEEAA